MKTTSQLIEAAEQLIQKSKDLRNFNDNDLHGKVARILINDEAKQRDAFYLKQRQRQAVKDKSPEAKKAVEWIEALEQRAWNEAEQLMMSDKERMVREHGNNR